MRSALDNRQNQWPKKLDRWLGIPLVCLCAIWRALVRPFWRRRKALGSGPRVLIIKLSALGDLVTMFPALYLLARELPGAHFDFLGGAANVPLAGEIDFFRSIYRFSVRTLSEIFKKNYDLVIDFDQWVRTTALLAATLRAARTVGFRSYGQHRHFAYDDVIDLSLKRHSGENFWNLAARGVKLLGGAVSTNFEDDRRGVRQSWGAKLTARPGPATPLPASYVVMHPGCGEHGKLREWPVESWRELIGTLRKERPEQTVVLTGHGDHEVALAQNLLTDGVTSLAGKINLNQLIKVINGAQAIFLCNTGIMHLASFLSDHVVSLNGPTDAVLWGPLWGGRNVNSPVKCAPCLTWGFDYGCSDPVCVKIIRPVEVVK